MAQIGAVGLGNNPGCQCHGAIRPSTAGSWAMTETGTKWLAPGPLTVVLGW
jgi:hypothetical protein